MTIERVLLLSALLTAVLVAAQTAAPPSVPPAADAAMQPSAAEAPVLGRLFFTPAERAQLDESRRRPPPKTEVAASKPEPPELPPPPKYVTLNGVVRRSDGVTTVWLNDKPVRDQRSEEGLVVATPARSTSTGHVTVRVPQTGRSVDLRVGQQLEVNSGQVQEAYETPRAPLPAAAPTEARAPEPPAAPSPPRRASRERDLLRDLLREIEGPEAGAKPAPSAPPK